jgi:beta-1,4-mannosyl-glycoprotein beta-1,4-N-acetylglucosaminyltransferase
MKIFDCFTFFNEIELLELRLMELYDFVDFFVIVEANKTHTGKEKEFIFEKNKNIFEKYLNKVIYVKVEDLPTYDINNIWIPENFQRNCILRGLHNIEIGDKVIVSDIDEIPNIETIKKVLNQNNPVTLIQDLFYYYVNCKQNCIWFGTIIGTYGHFSTPQELRNLARSGCNPIENGGWHYSFMGGSERIKTKVENIAESSYIINQIGDVNEIEHKIKNQIDLWNRTEDYAIKKIVDISNNKPKMLDIFLNKYPNFIF